MRYRAGKIRSEADNWELEPALETVLPEVGTPTTVPADAGYVRKKLIMQLASDPEAPELYVLTEQRRTGCMENRIITARQAVPV